MTSASAPNDEIEIVLAAELLDDVLAKHNAHASALIRLKPGVRFILLQAARSLRNSERKRKEAYRRIGPQNVEQHRQIA